MTFRHRYRGFFYLIVNQTKGTGFVVGKVLQVVLEEAAISLSLFVCIGISFFQSGANHFLESLHTNQRLWFGGSG